MRKMFAPVLLSLAVASSVLVASGTAQAHVAKGDITGSTSASGGAFNTTITATGRYNGHNHARARIEVTVQQQNDANKWVNVSGTAVSDKTPGTLPLTTQASVTCPTTVNFPKFRAKVHVKTWGSGGLVTGDVTVYRGQQSFLSTCV
jgi:hypothetical protein